MSPIAFPKAEAKTSMRVCRADVSGFEPGFCDKWLGFPLMLPVWPLDGLKTELVMWGLCCELPAARVDP